MDNIGFVQLPNDQRLIPALLAYSRQIADMLGFSECGKHAIQLAVEEACLDTINHAFAPQEKSHFDVTFFQRPDALEIHIHDMGLPYDPNAAPNYSPEGDLLEQDMSGLGAFLMKKMVDEYRFDNQGRQGKVVVLVKYFETRCIVDEAPPRAEPEVVEPPVCREVEQIPFEIRLMKDEEALEVCRCVYDCYGYSYANENIYYPERVAAMNEGGQLCSAVAITPEGEMGGHFALIFYQHLPAEIGIAVTKKKFRGQGFARQLGEFLEMQGRQRNLRGLQVKEVTAHPYTQKFCFKLGYKDCGLLLAHSPRTLSFKGIADNLKQRNSDVLGFKYLLPPERRVIHAPERHRDMIGKLYGNLGVEVDFHNTDLSRFPEAGQTVMSTEIHSLRSLAEMGILTYGSDVLQAVRQELRKLFREDIQVVELYLGLHEPATPYVVPQLEKMGFIFTGILPETRHGDSMIMQYFNGVYLDYESLVIVSDTARELLEYIRAHDPNAGN